MAALSTHLTDSLTLIIVNRAVNHSPFILKSIETGSRNHFLYLKACKLGREIEIFSSQCNGLKS